MSAMVEGLARELCSKLDDDWDFLPEADRETLRLAASAVVIMLRDPPPEMLAALWATINSGKVAAGIAKLGPGPGGRDVINAYIDAIIAG